MKKKNILGFFRNKIRSCYRRIMWTFFSVPISNLKEIPIIINNYNHLECLKKLISNLEDAGYLNIYIIDNNSSYKPLLEYYKSIHYKVFMLKKNWGYLALWKSGLYKQFKGQYYVYTDPDVVPADFVPDNYIEYFYSIMQKYRNAEKVGFGLRIDNIPDCYEKKMQVINWEKQFYQQKISDNLYRAAIDTTFALYRPYVSGPANFYVLHIRTGYPYLAEHLPWYQDSANPTEEDLYYKNHVQTSTHWSAKK